MTEKDKRPEPVWGPSVKHGWSCLTREDETLACNCPKRHYCYKCDAQHPDGRCSRTVLDDIVEAVTFKEKSVKTLINEILDAAESRRLAHYPLKHHIEGRIAELVERHGNLGMTRRKMANLVQKEVERRWRRHARDYRKKRRAEIQARGR